MKKIIIFSILMLVFNNIKSQNSEVDNNKLYQNHMIIGSTFTAGGVGLIIGSFFENQKQYHYTNSTEQSLNTKKQKNTTIFLAATGGICLTVGILNVVKAIDISNGKKVDLTAGADGLTVRYRF